MTLPPSALMFLLASGTLAAGGVTGEPPRPADIIKAVKDLGDDRFAVREKAAKFLTAAGEAAEEALRAAADSNDLEVKRRARDILERAEYGILPDAPAEVMDLVRRFRAGDDAARKDSMQKLLAHGVPGHAAVSHIAAMEREPKARHEYYAKLRQETPRLIAVLLQEKKLDDIERLLERCVRRREQGAGETLADEFIRDYAAFLFLRGTLAKKIAQFAGSPESANEPRTAEVLAYLHRANGDLASAIRAAQKSGNRVLERWLLWENCQWGELADRFPPRNDLKQYSEVGILGIQAAYQRLAGRTRDFEATLADLRRLSDDPKIGRSEAEHIADELLLNDRPQEGIDVLIRTKHYAGAFNFLRIQTRYKEALALADKIATEASQEDLRLEIERARLWHDLGEIEKAQAHFARLGEGIKARKDDEWSISHLVTTEAKLGLKDMAEAHAVQVLARPAYAESHSFVARFMDAKSEAAELWWPALRFQYGANDHLANLKRLRAIVDGTMAPDELRRLVDAVADGVPKRPRLQDGQRSGHFLVIAEAFRAAGLKEDASRYFDLAVDTATGAAPLMRLADAAVDRNDWVRAAALYGRAWEKDIRAPIPLFLQGWALTQAGQKEAGEKLLELAYWLPLGDEDRRYYVAEAQDSRGLDDLAARERDIVTRTGALRDVLTGNSRSNLSFAVASKGRYLEAARLLEAPIIGAYFDHAAYLRVPSRVHRFRARGLLAAGNDSRALVEMELCWSLLPGNIELPIEFTPLLAKMGRTKEADELFAKLFTRYEGLCADYPRAAGLHNDLAWLAARCRRELDKALAHAQTAVKLEPATASYLDTLAEVHFQRGDRTKAIELIRRCIELAPRREYFQRQLHRYEAGNRLADVPPG